MSYKETNHVFLYHAYALAAGGWVRRQGSGEYEALESIAPAVLSIAGGFSSSVRYNVNCAPLRRNPFGNTGPSEFFVHVGHAYTEIRGRQQDDQNAYNEYVTTVRSVLDDFRINDVVHVEHAETIVESRHAVPGNGQPPGEGRVFAGRSNADGVTVAGQRIDLVKYGDVDDEPTYGGMRETMAAGRPGTLIGDLAQSNGVAAKNAPKYVKDLCGNSANALRYSLFKSISGFPAYEPGYDDDTHCYGAAIHVKGFGRIYFGEVFASHGMKQVTMLRFDLGCDECGGYGGSGGSTNGTTFP